jgi:dienelactone hydrolase
VVVVAPPAFLEDVVPRAGPGEFVREIAHADSIAAEAANTPGPVTVFEVAKNIKCPFLGLYGAKDESPSPADATRFGDLLKQSNKNVEIVIYSAAGHGFFADYRPSYNATAAADAWRRCTAFFEKWLKV